MNAPAPASARSPQDSLLGLLCGYSSERRARKVLVMLTAYVDESVTGTNEKRLVYAGYVQEAEKWMAFSEEWELALRQTPAIRALHMNKLLHDAGDKERAAEKVRQMAAIIKHHEPLAFAVSVSIKEVREVFDSSIPKCFSDPYIICYMRVVQMLAYLMPKIYPTSGRIDVIFDEQKGRENKANVWFPRIKDALMSDVEKDLFYNPPIFRSDDDILPLQAADMLAWHMRRIHDSVCTDADRQACLDIGFRHTPIHVSREDLENMATGLRNIFSDPRMLKAFEQTDLAAS